MSCMATTTTNLGLTKPDYTDAADIAVINTNMDTVDTAITATKSDLGIVEDGNTATHSITAGQYVIWKGNLYTASSAIATGTTLSTSNLTAVSNGGLNSLNEQINDLIIVRKYTKQVTIDANSGIGIKPSDFDVSIPAGYSVLGFLGWHTTSPSISEYRSSMYNGRTTNVVCLANEGSSQFKGDVTITLAFIRSNALGN